MMVQYLERVSCNRVTVLLLISNTWVISNLFLFYIKRQWKSLAQLLPGIISL